MREGIHSFKELSWREGEPGSAGQGGAIPEVIPLPNNGLPWEATVDVNLTAQLQGTSRGKVPFPHQPLGCREAHPSPSPGSTFCKL